MKKNIGFIITAVVLAIATIAVGVLLIVKNIGETTVSLGDSKGINGDIVEIPLTIEKNHGIWGGQIIIDYDSDNISFISIENGTVFEGCEVNDTGDSVALLATQTLLKNTDKNGVIATLKFKIKANTDDGEHKLTFNSETNFCNEDEEMVEVGFNDGKIIVK